jgi:hypothetical protein
MGLLPVNPRESLLPLELEEALEQKKPVRMEYLDGRQIRTQRVIDPLHVRRSHGELILVAHCHLRGEQRTFKLERIVQLLRIDSSQDSLFRIEFPHGQENPGSNIATAQGDPAWKPITTDTGPDRPAAIDTGSL